MKHPTFAADRVRQRDPAREQSWRDTLKQFASSGRSVRAFCADRRLTESAFYFWRREIQRRDGPACAPRQCSTSGPVTFAKVLIQPAVQEEGLRLRLGNGRELLLPASWTPEQLAALLRALEEAA
jgi:hypothetical protein